MKIIFIHDHKFKVDSHGNFYSDGKFTNKVFQRYIFSKSDTIEIISRKINIDYNFLQYDLIDHSQIHFSCVKGINPFQIFVLNFFYNFKIFKKIFDNDLIIMRLPSFLGLFSCFLCFIFNKKYFIELVGHPRNSLLDNNSTLLRRLIAFFYSFLSKFVIKRANGTIYVTRSALQKEYPCLGITNYASNVVLSINKINYSKSSYDLKVIPKIGLIGSFNNGYKGIDIAIKSVSFLKNRENIILSLHILGNGTLLDFYKRMSISLGVEDQIFFDGVLPLEHVSKWLDDLDIYIQPSLTEGLPRSLIEAMSRGLPCVATNVGGIPELINQDYLIKPYDEIELAKKIKLLIESYDSRYQQGHSNILKSTEYDQTKLDQKRNDFWQIARKLIY